MKGLPVLLQEKVAKLQDLPHYLRSGDEKDIVALATAYSVEAARANQLQRELYRALAFMEKL